MASVGFRIDSVVREACAPKPLEGFELLCLKMATNKSEALLSRSGSMVHFQHPLGFHGAVATQK